MMSSNVHAESSAHFFDKYFAWLRVSLALLLVLPIVAALGTWSLGGTSTTSTFIQLGLATLSLLMFGWLWRVLGRPLRSWQKRAVRDSRLIERTVLGAPEKTVAWSIVLITACSLLLELSFIRWLASLYEVFSFYKNFVLLASFAGLGIGYSCSKRPLIYSVFVPLLSLILGIMVFLRFAPPDLFQTSLHFLPVSEQLNMAFFGSPMTVVHYISYYLFLSSVFCAVVLLFLPLGQLSGYFMNRLPNLKAYGMNLLGSLLGVLCMTLISQLWMPPIIWFGLAISIALPFFMASRRALLSAAIAAVFGLGALALASRFGYENIYSPYQLLQRGKADVGLTIQIIAAGQYYQRIIDLSTEAQKDPRLKHFAFYYNLPYQFKPDPESVLIVGAGAGNDVAAALRGGAKHVDAVEIDPAIYRLGKMFHPERPYENQKVQATITDARLFLQKTKSKYDLIVFGLLDSHAATSAGCQLRTDSYIYTLQSFKEAREHLKDDGCVVLSFVSISPQLDKKLRMMLEQSFHTEPISIINGYDGSITLIACKNGSAAVPTAVQDMAKDGYCQINVVQKNDSEKIDVSTDDWPFFYMTHKQFPLSFLVVLLLILALTVAMLFSFQSMKTSLKPQYLDFMFLGAGFMLIETKAITELGLYFGNTWQITSIVIAAILMMAFAANLAIERFKPKNILLPAVGLILSIVIGMYLHASGTLTHSMAGAVGATVILTMPILFSGVVFSTLLDRTKDISAAMAMNIMGALLGGALEYFALWAGYQMLYAVAVVIYVAAFVCHRIFTGDKMGKQSSS